MNFTHLLYFRKAVQYRSIHKAAKELFISPSGLSMALNSLEKELGYQLFIRSKSGLSLTPEGEDFLNDVDIILSMQKKWNEISKQCLIPTQAAIKIAVIPAIYNSVLGEIISNINNPDIYPIAIEYTCYEITNALINHHIRFAITSYNEGDEINLQIIAQNLNLSFFPLTKDHYSIYVSKYNPLYTKQHCCQADLANFTGVSMGHDSINQFDSQRFFDTKNTLYFHNQIFLLQKVANSNCFAILPSILQHNYYVQSEILHALDFEANIVPINYALIHPSDDQVTPLEREFVELLKASFQHLI